MSVAEVRQLPLAEKLQIMEAIWEDLRAQAEQVPVPDWHKELLNERRKAVEEGSEEVFDWDAVKNSLRSPRKCWFVFVPETAETWTRALSFTNCRRSGSE